MASQFVRTEKQDGVFVITMVDEKTRNALGLEMTAQLIEALDMFESSRNAKSSAFPSCTLF